MARRSYTDAERAEALALYAEQGPTAVQDQLGIAKSTVASWATANGVRTVRNERTAAMVEAARLDREHTRELLRDEMLRRALDLLSRMDEPHIDFRGKEVTEVTFPRPSPSGCQAYATAAAILLDKFRLEVGDVTGRHELVDPRRRLDAVRDELAERRGRVA